MEKNSIDMIPKPDGTVIAETLPGVSGDLVLFEITIYNF